MNLTQNVDKIPVGIESLVFSHFAMDSIEQHILDINAGKQLS